MTAGIPIYPDINAGSGKEEKKTQKVYYEGKTIKQANFKGPPSNPANFFSEDNPTHLYPSLASNEELRKLANAYEEPTQPRNNFKGVENEVPYETGHFRTGHDTKNGEKISDTPPASSGELKNTVPNPYEAPTQLKNNFKYHEPEGFYARGHFAGEYINENYPISSDANPTSYEEQKNKAPNPYEARTQNIADFKGVESMPFSNKPDAIIYDEATLSKFAAKNAQEGVTQKVESFKQPHPKEPDEDEKLISAQETSFQGKKSLKIVIRSELVNINAPKDCKFIMCRKVSGPLEVAIAVRFFEILLQENICMPTYLEELIALVPAKKSQMFKGFNDNNLTPGEFNEFKGLIEKIKKFVPAISEFSSLISKTAANMYASLQRQVAELIKELNKSSDLCMIVLKMMGYGKTIQDIANNIRLPIQILEHSSYKPLSNSQYASLLMDPLNPKSVISIAKVSENQYEILYIPIEVTALQNKEPQIQENHYANKPAFALKCGHIWAPKFDTPKLLNLKSKPVIEIAPKCQFENCFYVLNNYELEKAFDKEQFDKFMKIAGSYEPNACVFDGSLNQSNIKIDDKHYICVRCCAAYVAQCKKDAKKEDKGHFKTVNGVIKPIPLKCPVHDCKNQFDLNQYAKCLKKSELKEIEEKMKPMNAVPIKTILCEICKKDILGDPNVCRHTKPNKKDAENIKKEACALYHKKCLIEMCKELSKTKGIHEIVCKKCDMPFSKEGIENILKDNKDVLDKLKSNYNDKAETLKCPDHGQRMDPVERDKPIIKCPLCNCSVCRLCNNDQCNGVKCYPRYKRITELRNAGYKYIFPCPRCKQLNVMKLQEYSSICINCNAMFCGYCGADEEVIKNHGSTYHRPGCTRPGKLEKNGIDCELCKANQKFCKKPQELDNGELPKNEFFI